MLIIDTHAHVYSDDIKRFPHVPDPIGPSGGSGSFARLQAVAKESGVTRLCVVQPRGFYGWDNRYVCEISKASAGQVGAICSLNPDESSSPDELKRYVSDYGVRGLRAFAASDGHFDHPGVCALWKAAGEMEITITASIDLEQSEELAQMLERFQSQAVVIDHCFIANTHVDVDRALRQMKQLSKFANAYAKLSFLPLGSKEQYPYRDLHDACKSIIDSFGAHRCIWGGDFPCELWSPRSSYAQNLRLFTHELNLREDVKEAILGTTALQLWFRDKN
jgi:predicted TIM-barrel fold metal-dependent hydrolase